MDDVNSNPHLMTIRELAEKTQLPVSFFYERSRFNRIPGQRRIGKYVRVDADEFFAALEAGQLK